MRIRTNKDEIIEIADMLLEVGTDEGEDGNEETDVLFVSSKGNDDLVNCLFAVKVNSKEEGEKIKKEIYEESLKSGAYDFYSAFNERIIDFCA